MAPNIRTDEEENPETPISAGTKLAKSNIFSNLSQFYAPDDLLGRLDNSKVLVSLLDDFIVRKGFSLDDIIHHLTTFCQGHPEHDIQCRSFIHALLNLIQNSKKSYETTASHVQGLLRLLWKFSGTFSDIFSEIGGSQNAATANSGSLNHDGYERLQYYLTHGNNLDVRPSPEENPIRFINAPLAFGESPLMLASRNRCPDAVQLLLRHGADINTKWLYFQSSLEVLLFAPNQSHISKANEAKIIKCLNCHLRAVSHVSVTRFEWLTKDGYAVLLPKWQSLIPDSYYRSPNTLKQLARCAIRQNLNQNRHLPAGIQALPLPEMVKNFLDLQIH